MALQSCFCCGGRSPCSDMCKFEYPADELGIQTDIFPADKSYKFGKSRKLASLGGCQAPPIPEHADILDFLDVLDILVILHILNI